MDPDEKIEIKTDRKGRLMLSACEFPEYGIGPGENIIIEKRPDGLNIRLPKRLSRLYIEPTTRCNLNCRTCVRHSWDDPGGHMDDDVFERILEGLSQFPVIPAIVFGGFGEPLHHPRILDMVRAVKKLGAEVQLITNGTLLDKEMSRGLVEAGLDLLWVSLDGAEADSYTDVRTGASLPSVLENLKSFNKILESRYKVSDCGVFQTDAVELGIVFVAMKRNISDLPNVADIARLFGARHFLVTNVLPHTAEMRREILYEHTLEADTQGKPPLSMRLPRLDFSADVRDALFECLKRVRLTELAGMKVHSSAEGCPFILNGAGAVAWDGGFSPCLSLLHSHGSFLPERERYSRKWIVGNVKDMGLMDLWIDPKHLDFRRRVRESDFPPCIVCGGCEMAEDNEEDCWGNNFPTCGGCLWAQGLIYCP